MKNCINVAAGWSRSGKRLRASNEAAPLAAALNNMVICIDLQEGFGQIVRKLGQEHTKNLTFAPKAAETIGWDIGPANVFSMT